MNLQSWEEQVEEYREVADMRAAMSEQPKSKTRKEPSWRRKIGEIVETKPEPTPRQRTLLALERIAWENKRIANAISFIQFILVLWTAIALIFGIGFTIRVL